MAETTLVEPVETPPEEAAVVTPESSPESTPAPENDEDSSAIDEIVNRIGSAFVQDGGEDGKNAAPDGVVPPAGPTPEQIEANVRNKVAAENRIQGLKNLLMESGPNALMKFRPQYDGDEQREFDYIINQMKGAAKPLADQAVDVEQNYAPVVRQTALKEAEDWTLGQLQQALKEEFGAASAEAFVKANHGSWVNVGKYIAKEARKGYVPAEKVNETLKTEFAKVERSLKERGAAGIVTRSLAELKGSTGPDTPAARGGSGAQPKNYAEAEAWHASDKWTTAQFRAYKATHPRE